MSENIMKTFIIASIVIIIGRVICYFVRKSTNKFLDDWVKKYNHKTGKWDKD